jgi:hypothetical protein
MSQNDKNSKKMHKFQKFIEIKPYNRITWNFQNLFFLVRYAMEDLIVWNIFFLHLTEVLKISGKYLKRFPR